MNEAASFQSVTINVADEDTEATDGNTDGVDFFDWADPGDYYYEDNIYNAEVVTALVFSFQNNIAIFNTWYSI
jgi:hypothetical protein